MSGRLRAACLPAAALVLVGGVLGIQLANGGGSYEPAAPADPCAARTVTSHSDGIEGLAERLVLLGLDDAACRLGVSREALTLDLARSGTGSEAEIDAVRRGLLAAVDQLEAEGSLPPASELVDEALDVADLNPLLEALLRALPDSVVDAALTTHDVLTRAVEDLDLRTLLSDLDDPAALQSQVQEAVTQAVRDALLARLRGLV